FSGGRPAPLYKYSWQGIEISPSISFNHGPQLCRLNHLNIVAPWIERPCHFEMATGAKANCDAAILSLNQFLIGMETIAAHIISNLRAKAPFDLTIFPVVTETTKGALGKILKIKLLWASRWGFQYFYILDPVDPPAGRISPRCTIN